MCFFAVLLFVNLVFFEDYAFTAQALEKEEGPGQTCLVSSSQEAAHSQCWTTPSSLSDFAWSSFTRSAVTPYFCSHVEIQGSLAVLELQQAQPLQHQLLWRLWGTLGSLRTIQSHPLRTDPHSEPLIAVPIQIGVRTSPGMGRRGISSPPGAPQDPPDPRVRGRDRHQDDRIEPRNLLELQTLAKEADVLHNKTATSKLHKAVTKHGDAKTVLLEAFKPGHTSMLLGNSNWTQPSRPGRASSRTSMPRTAGEKANVELTNAQDALDDAKKAATEEELKSEVECIDDDDEQINSSARSSQAMRDGLNVMLDGLTTLQAKTEEMVEEYGNKRQVDDGKSLPSMQPFGGAGR